MCWPKAALGLHCPAYLVRSTMSQYKQEVNIREANAHLPIKKNNKKTRTENRDYPSVVALGLAGRNFGSTLVTVPLVIALSMLVQTYTSLLAQWSSMTPLPQSFSHAKRQKDSHLRPLLFLDTVKRSPSSLPVHKSSLSTNGSASGVGQVDLGGHCRQSAIGHILTLSLLRRMDGSPIGWLLGSRLRLYCSIV